MHTIEDMRLPTTAKYCEVMAWLHAEGESLAQIRISFAHPEGAKTSLTVSPTHFMMRLTSPGIAKGASAASVHQFGRFESVGAKDIKVGDMLAVLTDTTNPAAGFTAVSVENVDSVKAEGAYLPALESPYIVADGVVAPLYINEEELVAVADGLDGAKNAGQQYQHAPLYMTRVQPVGIAGKDAKAQGAHITPEAGAILRAKREFVRQGKALNYAALKEWWQGRHLAWKADASKVVSVDDVLALLNSDVAWVQRTGVPNREEWTVTLAVSQE